MLYALDNTWFHSDETAMHTDRLMNSIPHGLIVAIRQPERKEMRQTDGSYITEEKRKRQLFSRDVLKINCSETAKLLIDYNNLINLYSHCQCPIIYRHGGA
jgi:hypothetical protein